MMKFISLSMLLSVLGCSDGKGGNDNTEAAIEAPAPSSIGPAALTPPSQRPSVIPAIPTPPPSARASDPSETQGPFALTFDAQVKGQALKCYDKTPAMAAEGQVFTDLRLFVSNLTLVNDQGVEVKVLLDVAPESANLQFTDERTNSIALLNFLEADCAVSDATKILKNAINGVLPFGSYTAVKFQVGLPYPSMDAALSKIPAALAPSDMAWMWEHFPADFQIETNTGSAKKILNALTSAAKTTVTLPLPTPFIHSDISSAENSQTSKKVNIELSKLFLTTPEDFVAGLEMDCANSTKAMSEASPHCAHAFKAFGLPVLNPKDSYEQSVFTIAP